MQIILLEQIKKTFESFLSRAFVQPFNFTNLKRDTNIWYLVFGFHMLRMYKEKIFLTTITESEINQFVFSSLSIQTKSRYSTAQK